MFRQSPLFVIFFLCWSCSQAPLKIDKIIEQKPQWVQNPKSFCPKGYLCANGTAESRTLAAANARVELGKQFSVQVKSKFTNELSQDDDKIFESSFASIDEVISLELKGVEITDYWESQTHFFAFAQIRKSKLIFQYKQELDDVDKKVSSLLPVKKLGQLWTIEELLRRREIIGNKLTFLTGSSYRSLIGPKELMKIKERLTDGLLVHFNFKDKFGKEFKGFLLNIFTDIGLKFQKGQTWKPGSTHLLKGSMEVQKEHFKVIGFEKYNFIVNIEIENSKRVKSSSINYNVSNTGRSKRQAYIKSLVELKAKFIENLDKLSFSY